jgi:hypothetical protein
MSELSIIFGKPTRTLIGVDESTEANRNPILSRLSNLIQDNLGARAGITVDATINESHRYTAEITDNPIESGGETTDHVHLNPFELDIEGIISDSPIGYGVVSNFKNVINNLGKPFGRTPRSIEACDELLALYRNRLPFTVVTSLKKYSNMIISNIEFPRNAQTGNAIIFRATFRQIQIVNTQEVEYEVEKEVKNRSAKIKNKGTVSTKSANQINNGSNSSIGGAAAIKVPPARTESALFKGLGFSF